MAEIRVQREKSWIGMAIRISCFVNGKLICELKNGEACRSVVPDGIICFECRYNGSTYDGTAPNRIYLDTSNSNAFVRIFPEKEKWIPSISVDDSTITVNPSDLPALQQTELKHINSLNTTVLEKPLSFVPTKKISNYFAINEETKQWTATTGIISILGTGKVYSYSDLLDFELIENGESVAKGGLGRAVVGGVLFGGIGAVVGGVTGKRKTSDKCTSLKIKITTKDISKPTCYINLISSTVAKTSSTYKTEYKNAQEILSILQIICKQVESETASIVTTSQPTTDSNADEIRKYKELLDDGIITQDEFNAKKKQLLGL